MKLNILVLVLAISACLGACKEDNKPLPRYGNIDIVDGDTIFHKIAPFKFINQDSQFVTNESLSDFIYISDVFFIHCPTICPKVKKQMLRLYKKFDDEPMVKLVSQTVDPKRDDVPALKAYANKLDIDHDKWLFLTGDIDELYKIANDYFQVAKEDPTVPGGFDHSGKLILTDKEGHVRAFCEGTDPSTIPKFIKDVEKLIDEYRQST